MYHAIRFHVQFTVGLEIAPKQLEQLVIQKGDQLRTRIKPHVAEGADGPVEVADLYFENGTISRNVPFSLFAFVD